MEKARGVIQTTYRTHTCNDLNGDNNDQTVTLSGWVNSRRDHGGVIFVDLRDRYGITQVVFDPTHNPEVHALADALRDEWVIKITGKVRMRPEGQKNDNLDTGAIEVITDELEILNKSKTLPFVLNEHTNEANEELRLEYRYLDLRRERMQNIIKLRHKVMKWTRDYFDEEGFLDIETPGLIKGTPEGSREFVVPSRLHPGEFFVLPQAPQQFKQLLMLAGFDKYFQFAHCYRDEDMRADRQPEFTQLDIELSFATQETVHDVLERWAIGLSKALVPKRELVLNEGKIPVITWDDCLNTYGLDKPDTRFEMKLVEATDLFRDAGVNFITKVIEDDGVVKALPVKGGATFARSQIDGYVDFVMRHGAGGMAYLIWDESGELRGSIAKLISPEKAEEIKSATGAENGDAVFFIADKWEEACNYLGVLRGQLGKDMNLIDENKLAYLWVINFPMFEVNDEGEVQAAHHPFTRPLNDEHLELMRADKLKARATAYDLVLNGYELGSGSIRIHERDLQQEVFDVMGISREDSEKKFGHILKAFEFGAPPHGGMALGIDRVIMVFAGTDNIREVVPFPKTQKVRDLMMGAPTPLPEKALREQNVQILQDED